MVHPLPPRRPKPLRPNPSGALAMLLVLGLAVGIWLLAGRDPGSSTGLDPGNLTSDRATAVEPTASGSPTSEPTPDPTSDPTSEPTSQESVDPASGLPWVDLTDLPPEAGETLALIDRGGPFPYDRDGVTFGNFEGILPDRERGYYAEYTVPTPGSDSRGARRIVTGEADEAYWTADHYESFARIRR